MSEIPELIHYVSDQRLFKDYIIVAAVAIQAYDYILTLYLEIKHIWFSRWTYTKIVFLLIRYNPFVFTALLLKHQAAMDVPDNVCRTIFPLAAWLMQINILLSELIIAIRTWAIWYRDRSVGVGLAMLMTIYITTTCFFMDQLLKALIYVPVMYPGFRGCSFQGDIRQIILHDWITICAAQFIIFTLVAISAFRSYRSGYANGLLHVIHRDGILIYVYLVAVTVANLITVFTMPPDLSTSLVQMTIVLYSVLVNRTILNIRTSSGSRNGISNNMEVHSIRLLPEPVFLPLVAIPASR